MQSRLQKIFTAMDMRGGSQMVLSAMDMRGGFQIVLSAMNIGGGSQMILSAMDVRVQSGLHLHQQRNGLMDFLSTDSFLFPVVLIKGRVELFVRFSVNVTRIS